MAQYVRSGSPLRGALLLAVVLLAGALSSVPCRTAEPARHESGRCASASSTARLAPDGEPGTPLIVRGHVFRADGTTPAAGVILYVYQTDATGVYHARGEDAPRLRAWLRTDAQGAYEYRTIRPASYPGTTVPAHVHTQFWGGGVPAQYGPELRFEDDPYVPEPERAASAKVGRFAWVKQPVLEGGTLTVVHDMRLETEGASFESNTMHGYAACR